MAKIAINGSSGFIGNALVSYLRKSGHDVLTIPRRLYLENDLLENVLKDREVIINLAGESIVGLWTKKKRRKIYNSRIDVTRTLVRVINSGNTAVKRVISASAIGIYIPDVVSDEYTKTGTSSFLSRVCNEWEEQIKLLEPPVKFCIARVGVVVGNEGGVLQRLNSISWTRTGIVFGKGDQNMPLIHIEDVCRSVEHLIVCNNLSGIFNLVCPSKISNADFTAYYGSLHNFILYFKVPRWILKLLLGEVSGVFIDNHIVEPKRLLDSRFVYSYPDARTIIEDCYKKIMT
jgi:uncharacterized protein